MASRGLTVAVIAFLLLSLAVFGYFAGSKNEYCSFHPTDVGCTTTTSTAISTMTSTTTSTSTSTIPTVRHVITIVMENEEYSQVIGDPSAPYENALAVNYTLLTSYYAVRHPSLPNYLAMVSGTTQNVSSDCLPSQCSTNSSSIVDLLQSHGLTWKEYAESMPTNCSQTVSSDGLYQPKHGPFVYFSSITGNHGTGQTSAYCK
jgi:phospholipase C